MSLVRSNQSRDCHNRSALVNDSGTGIEQHCATLCNARWSTSILSWLNWSQWAPVSLVLSQYETQYDWLNRQPVDQCRKLKMFQHVHFEFFKFPRLTWCVRWHPHFVLSHSVLYQPVLYQPVLCHSLFLFPLFCSLSLDSLSILDS